jgi:hypothetical protein
MKLTNLKRSVGGAILTASLLFGVGASVTAQAQYRGDQNRRDRRNDRREERQERRQERREERRGRDWNGYGNYGGSSQLRQTALNAGYNEGIEDGRTDRRRNERFSFTDESDYRNASKDYSSRLGDRGLYQRYFRAGFENGYRDGYNGY